MNSRIGILFLGFILASCANINEVRSHYATRKDAEADQLFQRGWLPSIIPTSSYQITTKNDLDFNLSNGEFFVSPGEMYKFTKLLTPYSPLKNPYTNFKEEVSQKKKQGFKVYSYSEDNSQWVFFVNENAGHVVYTLWTKES